MSFGLTLSIYKRLCYISAAKRCLLRATRRTDIYNIIIQIYFNAYRYFKFPFIKFNCSIFYILQILFLPFLTFQQIISSYFFCCYLLAIIVAIIAKHATFRENGNGKQRQSGMKTGKKRSRCLHDLRTTTLSPSKETRSFHASIPFSFDRSLLRTVRLSYGRSRCKRVFEFLPCG